MARQPGHGIKVGEEHHELGGGDGTQQVPHSVEVGQLGDEPSLTEVPVNEPARTGSDAEHQHAHPEPVGALRVAPVQLTDEQ